MFVNPFQWPRRESNPQIPDSKSGPFASLVTRPYFRLAELEGFEPSGRYSRPAPQQGAHISHSCTTPDLELSAGFEPATGISPQRFCRPLPSTTRLQDSLILVAGTRFERILNASEALVLPLHQPAISLGWESNPHVLADTRF